MIKIQPKKEINEQVITKLQSNIKLEYESGSLYEGMAAWADYNSFANLANFYRIHSLEKRKHASWVIDFLQDMNIMAYIPTVNGPDYSWKTTKDILEKTYEHEEMITKTWNDTATLALKVGDHMSYRFAQKMLDEQREELDLFSSLIDQYNLTGEGQQADYLFDDDIEHPSYSLPSWV